MKKTKITRREQNEDAAGEARWNSGVNRILNKYLTDCKKCGFVTNKTYAEAHKGKCKPCTTGGEREKRHLRTAASYTGNNWQ